MMPAYNFADRVRRALALARERAAALQSGAVHTEHILLSLLTSEHEVVHAMLSGARLEDLLWEVREQIPTGIADIEISDLEYTAAAMESLMTAMKVQREIGPNVVDVEHVLLGLLLLEGDPCQPLLERHGVTYESALADLKRHRGKEDRPRPPRTARESVIEHTTLATAPRVVAAKPREKGHVHVVADLEAIPANLIVGFMSDLDALHRALGGGGLRIEEEGIGVLRESRARA